jgi:Tfp pilus assembly protein PilF
MNRLEKLKKIWPFLASLGGASVMVLAFFIPSIQDQWDRYQSREVIEQYEKLGNEFFDEGHFAMAEEAYKKAFEFSEQKRLDIEVKRLDAKINRVNENPVWGGKLPDSLKEIDFQYLLHFQKDRGGARARILNSYGVFLSSLGRLKEAEGAFNEALRLDSKNDLAHVNLGSLFRQQGKALESEHQYLKAISIDPENAITHYNLGLLFSDQGNLERAKKEFARALALDPEDSDVKAELALTKDKLEKKRLVK